MSDENNQSLADLMGKPIPALKTQMGLGQSYIVSVPLSWVAQRVQYAGKMPIFHDHADSVTGEIEVNEFTVDHILQRRPDWRRQMSLSSYLLAWESHKFPPLLVVGYQAWAHQEDAEEWGINGKAVRDTVVAEPSGDGETYRLLTGNGTEFYALDGQHRLMAIQGVRALKMYGELCAKNYDGNDKENVILSVQDIAEAVKRQSNQDTDEKAIRKKLDAVMAERIGIEIIPAVIKGEKMEEATFRLRNIFVDVNENAKKPSVGQSILLDERDGFRMVARELMRSHKVLDGRIEVKSGHLPPSSECYTTLKALAEISEAYLGYKEFSNWKTPLIRVDPKSGRVRPSNGPEFKRGIAALQKYFDALGQLPSHKRMIQNESPVSSLREKEQNMLFRPMIQVALAGAIAILVHKHGKTMGFIAQKLRHREGLGQLKLSNSNAPWCGVMWDPVNKTMLRAKPLCRRLFVYLLGGELSDKELNRLRSDYAKARQACNQNPCLPAPW